MIGPEQAAVLYKNILDWFNLVHLSSLAGFRRHFGCSCRLMLTSGFHMLIAPGAFDDYLAAAYNCEIRYCLYCETIL